MRSGGGGGVRGGEEGGKYEGLNIYSSLTLIKTLLPILPWRLLTRCLRQYILRVRGSSLILPPSLLVLRKGFNVVPLPD